MSGDILYEMFRCIGYRDRQKEIARVRAGLATPDDKHELTKKIRVECSLTSAPQQKDFANYVEYIAAKAKYDVLQVQLKDQLHEIGYNYNNDSETSELERLTKKIRSEMAEKPVEDVKPSIIANPNLNKDKFRPEDFPRNAGSQ